MPYKSKAQSRFMHSQEPEIAKEFDEKTSKSAFKKLPEHVSKDKNGLKSYNKKHKRG
jgi:hypothetical protein